MNAELKDGLKEKYNFYKVILNSRGLDLKVEHDTDPKKVVLRFPMLGEVVLGDFGGDLAELAEYFHVERSISRWSSTEMQDSFLQFFEGNEEDSLKPSTVADIFMAHPQCQAYVFGRRGGTGRLYECEDPRHPITGQKLDDYELAIPQMSGSLFHDLDKMGMQSLCKDLMMAMYKPIPVFDSDETLSFVDLAAVIFGTAQKGHFNWLLSTRGYFAPKYQQDVIDNAMEAKPKEHQWYYLYETALFNRIVHYMGNQADLDPVMTFWPSTHMFRQNLEVIERLKREKKEEK